MAVRFNSQPRPVLYRKKEDFLFFTDDSQCMRFTQSFPQLRNECFCNLIIGELIAAGYLSAAPDHLGMPGLKAEVAADIVSDRDIQIDERGFIHICNETSLSKGHPGNDHVQRLIKAERLEGLDFAGLIHLYPDEIHDQ